MSNHSDHQLTLINNTLMHHQQRLDEFSKETNKLNIDIAEIRNDIRKICHSLKNIEAKFSGYADLDKRVKTLEENEDKEEEKKKLIIRILKFAGKIWWVWVLIIFCIFAFDVKIEVQNPHLVHFVTEIIKNKL